jgi:phage baseplate assembly protein W
MTQPFRKTQYRGYSTTDRRVPKINELYDVDLVRADILNRLNTRKTERVRNADYGSKLKDMLFELKTEANTQEVIEEVISVIQSEPRVSIVNIDVNTDRANEIRIDIDLLYQPFDVQFEFKLLFDLKNGIIVSEDE